MRFSWLMIVCILMTLSAATSAEPPEKWFYAYVDLHNDTHRDDDAVNFGTKEMIALMPRLKGAGYDVIVLSNYYLAAIHYLDGTDSEGETWRENLVRLKKAAARHDIEIIPEVMAVGSSGSLLLNNPHLAEGAPVRNCEYVVRKAADGTLQAEVRNTTNSVEKGEFEDDPQVIADEFSLSPGHFAISRDTSAGDGVSLLFDAAADDVFLKQQNITLKPQHQYSLSFQLKTEGLVSSDPAGPNLYSIVEVTDPDYGPKKIHRIRHPVAKSAGTWHTYVVSLNSFRYTTAEVAVGLESVTAGEVWIDNVSLREANGVNLLRRDELPLVVTRADGTALSEGTDFGRWINPETGLDGAYLPTDNAGPITIMANSGLKDGDVLHVSYFHAQLPDVEAHRVCSSLLNEGVIEIHRKQIQLLNQQLSPKRWLLNNRA